MKQRGLSIKRLTSPACVIRLMMMVSLTSCAYLLSAGAAPRSQRDQTREARREVTRAEKAIERKDYPRALEHFKRADLLLPDLKNKISIAILYHKLNRCSESFNAWQDVLNLCQQGCRYQERVRASHDKMTASCTAPLSISSTPSARVSVNGRDVGPTPLQTSLLLGSHKLELRARGYQRVERWINIESAQQRLELNIPLEPLYGSNVQRVLQTPIEPPAHPERMNSQVKLAVRVAAFGLGTLSGAMAIFYHNQLHGGAGRTLVDVMKEPLDLGGQLLLGGAGLFFVTGVVTFF